MSSQPRASMGRFGRRRGLTLVEILVAVAILAILASLAVVVTGAVIDSAKKTAAKSGMQLIASAIEAYSQFWPASEAVVPGDPASRATAGFPEWDFDYLWGIGNTPRIAVNPDNVSTTDDEIARAETNECLSHCLLSPRGGGPYLKNAPENMVQSMGRDFATRLANSPYSVGSPPGAQQPVRQLVDPWGTPYMFQWLDGSNISITGVAPINVAVKYRLISAGPDGLFGNMGTGATAAQVSAAGDNLYHGPEPQANDTKLMFR